MGRGRNDDTGQTRVISIEEEPQGRPTATEEERAMLVLIYPPGPAMGRRFPLAPASHVIGRLEEADITISADSVSRRHARIGRSSQGWFIEDLGSTNGCLVNDERTDYEILRDGDIIRLGDVIFKFLSGANIEAAYHDEIYKMSILDGLTGVHNKRFFMEFLGRETARAARHAMPISLVLFDIDHFKAINDTHGHLAGDHVLRDLCRRLKARIRREDLLARYGGEEFACILSNTGIEGARRFAEDVRVLVEREPFLHEGVVIPATVSLGVAEMPLGASWAPEDLIRRADENLYAAKRSGRNRVVG